MPEKDCSKCNADIRKIINAYHKMNAENRSLKNEIQMYREILRQKNELIEEKSSLIAQLLEVERG